MPAHMVKKQRTNRAAYLLIALGVGLAVFALVDPDPRDDIGVRTSTGHPASSAPTVLGSVVTRATTAPVADAAAPATFDVRTTTSRQGSRRGATPSTTTPPPTIGTPWSIENTTTTDGTTTTSVTDTTTSTTEPTTTTESTTTTSAP